MCTSMHVQKEFFDGLVQERHNSSALEMESRVSCMDIEHGYWFFLCKYKIGIGYIKMYMNHTSCLKYDLCRNWLQWILGMNWVSKF